MLKSVLGTPGIVHVPYAGQAPALADLLAGKVSMMFGNWPDFRDPIAAGKLNALGMASEKRFRLRAIRPRWESRAPRWNPTPGMAFWCLRACPGSWSSASTAR